ncbi:MAG TPA: SBBP repeat-containing protein [Bacteroidia bacterium]|nr:SBBP repeat-containing protein [Bacteroidia bacterium]
MSFRIYLLISFALHLSVMTSDAQSFQWAKSIISEGYDEGYDLATDSDGNTYVAGMIEFDTDFGNGVILSSAGIHDIFLAKYNSSGSLVWAKIAGGKGGDKIQSIVLDGAGHIYVTGEYEDTCYFESIMKVTTGAGVNNMFVAKYDTSGSVMWVKNITATGVVHTRGYGITCDAQGNVYACGGTKGDTYFEGNYLFTSAGDYDGTVVKFDPNGNFVWARRMGGSDSDKTYGIASDNNGAIYVTGYFVGSADFSPSFNLNGNGHTDIFLAKYATDGTFQWAKMAGDTGFDRGWDVMVNVNGQIIMTGEFQTGYFGSTQIFSRGNQDMFLAAYDSNGNNLWALPGGGVEDDIGRGLGHDAAGNILVVGDYADIGHFPPQTVTSNGYADLFAASYSADGSTLNWIKSAGGHDSDRGRGIGSDSDGNTYICGEFIDSIQMGNTNMMGNLYLDIYVSKIGINNICTAQLAISSQNSCAGQCDGTAVATVTGQSPFNYAWSTTPAQFTSTATGLCAGIYSVTTTDALGCTATASVTLTGPAALQVTTSTTGPTCAGTCTGTATASASGQNPFTYSWSTSPVQTGGNATGLCAGNYSVLVTDNQGCTSTSSVTVTEPLPLQLSAVITNSTCIGCYDGEIDVTVAGGTPGFQYLWSIGEITEDLSILLAGIYSICVIDQNGCSLCDTYTVLDPGTGISDNATDVISFYPNPFSTSATIHLNSSVGKTTKLILYSSTGQSIYETEFSGSEFILNAGDFSKGVYFLQLKNDSFENGKIIPVVIGD